MDENQIDPDDQQDYRKEEQNEINLSKDNFEHSDKEENYKNNEILEEKIESLKESEKFVEPLIEKFEDIVHHRNKTKSKDQSHDKNQEFLEKSLDEENLVNKKTNLEDRQSNGEHSKRESEMSSNHTKKNSGFINHIKKESELSINHNKKDSQITDNKNIEKIENL